MALSMCAQPLPCAVLSRMLENLYVYLLSPPFALSMSDLSALENSLTEDTGIKSVGSLAAKSSKDVVTSDFIITRTGIGLPFLKLRVFGMRSKRAASLVTAGSISSPFCRHAALSAVATGSHSSRG